MADFREASYRMAGAIAVSFVCIAVIAAFGYEWHAARFFAAALNSNTSEQISVDGIRYDVTNGAVSRNGTPVHGPRAWRAVRLAYEVTLARRDPILALPGNDPDALTHAIDQLAAAVKTLAAKQSTKQDAAAVQYLYPIRFLRAAEDLEDARLELMRDPTEAHARRYERALTRTAHTQTQDLAAFSDAFDRSVIATSTYIALFSGILTPESARITIAQYRNGADTIEIAARKRDRCVEGIVHSCSPLPSSAHPIRSREPDSTPFTTAREVGALWRDASESAASTFGALLEHSACLPLSPGAHRATLLTQSVEGEPLRTLTYADDIFFNASSVSTSSPYVSYARTKLAMQYLPVNAFKYYVCPQVGIDFGAVTAIERTVEFARAHAAIAPTERAALLTNADFPRESDADAYLNIAWTQADVSTTDRHAIEELLLIASRQTAGLDQIVRDIAHVTTVDSTKLGAIADTSAASFFLTHSAFPTFFRTGDPSTLYTHPRTATERFKKQIVPYTSLRHTVARTVLLHDLRSFLVLENRIPSSAPTSTPASANTTF